MAWLFSRTPELVDPHDALAGGHAPVLEHPRPHTVLGTQIDMPASDGRHSVIMGLGCFWGAEKLFWQLPGVITTAVGYAGGVTPNPTYREVCTGRTNHAEVVRIVFDPQKISLAEIVAQGLEAHDPTQGFRQGNDVGTQYRSVIYIEGDAASDDAALAQRLVDRFGERLAAAGYGQITTEVAPLAQTPAGEFYLAEDEHQQYLDKNPGGYCPVHSTGVACGPVDEAH